MATFEVTKETIQVFPHPNADRLELARVGLYNVVVGKGQYASGDEVIYIPEYAVLPPELIVSQGLEGKLAGRDANRVKPVKLRGELSQGLVAPLSVLPEGTPEMQDYSEVLGITKWEPEIPASMSGDTEGNYGLVSWIEVENLKKFPDMFIEGEPVMVSEKIHGTAQLVSILNPLTNPEVLVSSKGLGERKLVLKENESNVYWRSVRENKLPEFARFVAEEVFYDFRTLADENPVFNKVALFGETFGSKIQDLHYGKTGGVLGFALFDIFVDVSTTDGTRTLWLDPRLVESLATKFGVTTVPTLYTGPFDMDLVAELASGKEQVSGLELHIREGVVVRPVVRGEYEAGKRIGKFVSEAYLLRKNGTEYS